MDSNKGLRVGGICGRTGTMTSESLPDLLRTLEIPGRVTFSPGKGGLPKMNVTSDASTAEIYLHGAHITAFEKNGEPPLLFMSAKSHFAPGDPIRGGVPICFPWFGPRQGGPAHGLARILPWEPAERPLVEAGRVTIHLRLSQARLEPEWSELRTEFIVTVADTLTMELFTANESPNRSLKIEDCLHTYFHVSDIGAVSITGLKGLPFDDFAAGAAGARKCENDSVLRIAKEINRVYANHSGTVQILDEKFGRSVRVEKSGSQSTVVWNPWTTQKMPGDFDTSEHKHMVCVESGNVKQNGILLGPGQKTRLKVNLSSRPV